MSIDSFELPVPVVRQVQTPQPIVEAPQQVADVHMAQPSQEHARAVERAFAHQPQGSDALGNLMGLAMAGILLHDVVADTLAEPEEEEGEDDKVTR
jgi:cytochrome b